MLLSDSTMRTLVILFVISVQILPCLQQGCSKYEFHCGGGICIPQEQVCDGAPDCPKNADENRQVCSSVNCPRVFFRCDYGACINQKEKCNGINNCADGSDEKDCTNSPVQTTPTQATGKCKSFEFQCKSGHCIDNDLVCDATIHCPDGSDEIKEICGKISCGDFGFRCKYGACIERKKRCNRKTDCPDGSDESNEECDPSGPIPSGGCMVPKKPIGGDYTLKCSKPSCEPIAPLYSILKFECSPGFKTSRDSVQYCIRNILNGTNTWSPEGHLPPCYKECETLGSRSVVYTCGQTQCRGVHLPGTTAKVKCRDFYKKPENYSEEQSKLHCLTNGTWDREPFKCIPKCGEPLSSSVIPLISYGNRTKAEEHPWQAAIYEIKETKYEHICGGTIIAPKFILSAAHCFKFSSGLTSADKIKVAVGKYHRSIQTKDPHQQEIPVKQIFANEWYIGGQQNHVSDIALLLLQENIQLSSLVMPACIDWKDELKPKKNDLATLAGWGQNELYLPTEELMVAYLPYMGYSDCIDELKKMEIKTFEKFITYDKFCLFYVNGTGAQQGDSGGGATMQNQVDKLHYVTGVVSFKPSSAVTKEDSVSFFTNIKSHFGWIRDILKTYDSL